MTAASPTRRLRIGLLGASAIAPYALIEPARRRTDVALVAIAARDPERARQFAAHWQLPAVASSYAELIARDDVDLVYVALPPALHCEWTLRALAQGKAVLCEKPFALNASEARAMIQAAEAARRPLIEAFHYRFHPSTHRAITLGRERLGPLRALRAMVSGAGPTQAHDIRLSGELGGGALLDLGCYAVHALRTLSGSEPIVRAARVRRRGSVDVETVASLEFPGGIQAHLRCAFDDGPFVNDLGARGTLGELTVRGFMLPQEGGELAVSIGTHAETHAHPDVTSYEAQLEHVVEVMLRDAPPLTGGADALANMIVLDGIRDAALLEPSM